MTTLSADRAAAPPGTPRVAAVARDGAPAPAGVPGAGPLLPPAADRPRPTARHIQQAIWRHFSASHAVLFEVSTDLRPEAPGTPARRRRIDALLVRRVRKAGIGALDLLALEIKVSRADFLADVRDPAKQAAWRATAHRHAYAAPAGMIAKNEVPAGSGLLEIGTAPGAGRRGLTWTIRAPYTGSGIREVPPWLTLAIAYRMGHAESQIRGLTGAADDDIQTAAGLRAELIHARHELRLLTRRLDRAAEAAERWRIAYAAAGALPCKHCGCPVRPKEVAYGAYTDWRHVTPADEPACAEKRAVVQWSRIEPATAPDIDPELEPGLDGEMTA